MSRGAVIFIGLIALILVIRSPQLVQSVFHDASSTANRALTGCDQPK